MKKSPNSFSARAVMYLNSPSITRRNTVGSRSHAGDPESEPGLVENKRVNVTHYKCVNENISVMRPHGITSMRKCVSPDTNASMRQCVNALMLQKRHASIYYRCVRSSTQLRGRVNPIYPDFILAEQEQEHLHTRVAKRKLRVWISGSWKRRGHLTQFFFLLPLRAGVTLLPHFCVWKRVCLHAPHDQSSDGFNVNGNLSGNQRTCFESSNVVRI